MITKNFKRVLSCLITMHGTMNPYVPIRIYNGNTQYIGGKHSVAGLTSPVTSVVMVNTKTAYGIKLGNGTTPPTEDDYQLESQITSGITATTTDTETKYDELGNPYVDIEITVTNTGESAIQISEVGSFQNIPSSATEGGGVSNTATMLDRTVFDNPVTIPAGEAARITYTLKPIIFTA